MKIKRATEAFLIANATLLLSLLMACSYRGTLTVTPVWSSHLYKNESQELSQDDIASVRRLVKEVAQEHDMDRDPFLSDLRKREDEYDSDYRTLDRYVRIEQPLFGDSLDVRMLLEVRRDLGGLMIVLIDRELSRESDFTRSLRESLTKELQKEGREYDIGFNKRRVVSILPF